MKNIWLLTKIQLGSLGDVQMPLVKNKKGINKKGFLFYCLAIFILLAIFGSSISYSFLLGTSLQSVGMLELLPELMMTVTCIATLLTTIYKVKGTLVDFKDYDMVMSLPIKTSEIVASRLLLIYSINILFVVLIMIPAAIAYGVLAKPEALFYIMSAVAFLFIPLVPIIIATVIGTIITVIAARFKHSNMINLIINILFFSLVMIVSFSFNNTKKVGSVSSSLTQQVDGMYPLARMYRFSVINYDLTSLIFFILISIIGFIIFSYLVGIKFKKINTDISSIRTKSNFKLGKLNQTSPFMAIYRKEFKRFFSSSLYVLNSAFGLIMMTIFAIALLFSNNDQIAELLEIPELANMMGTFVPIIVCFCIAMTIITASSISLEGKNLWILKSSPLPTKTIFDSKIAVSLSIMLPFVFVDGILIAFALQLCWKEFLILIIMPTVYSFFTSISGLVLNLKLPKLNWTSEVTVIKQSLAALIAIFGGILTAVIPLLLINMLHNVDPIVINGLTSMVFALLSLVLYRYLITKGVKIFNKL